MRAIAIAILGTWAAVHGQSQTHPYSNAWSYYTSTTTANAEFTATTVAGTGGTATHTMSQVVIYVQSPNGRSASAYDYPSGTTGQATVYLSLCGGGTCEDGQFFASTANTAEICGQTSQVLYLDTQSNNNTVNPWVRWTGSTTNPTSIARQNGESDFVATLQRSVSCGGVQDLSCGAIGNPTTIQIACDPNSSKPANFTGALGSVNWKIKTTSSNPHSGSVVVGASINATACTVNGPPGTTANLTVN